jgi:hypothetical protein
MFPNQSNHAPATSGKNGIGKPYIPDSTGASLYRKFEDYIL